jgi:hypothetical protein
MSQNHNKVIRLNKGIETIRTGDAAAGSELRTTPGYPIFSRWARPIVGYDDINGDGILQKDEVVLGDSTVYLGAQDPNYTLNVSSNWTLLHGRVTVNTLFAYTDGVTQINQSAANRIGDPSSPYTQAAGNPDAPLWLQAAAIANTPYGITQTVSTLRFQSMSVNYNVPMSIAQFFHARTLVVSLQGSNLWLHTNYYSKDPDVNVNSTGNITIDGGQLPQPRTWSLRIAVGS